MTLVARRWRVTVAGGHPLTAWSRKTEWVALQAIQASRQSTVFLVDNNGAGIELRDAQIINTHQTPTWISQFERILKRTGATTP